MANPNLERVQAAVKQAKAEMLLVAHPPNIRYLTGFAGSNALVAVFPERMVFWTDPRYTLQATRDVGPDVKIATKPLMIAAVEYAKRLRIRRVGFEREHLRFDQFEALSKQFHLVPVSGLMEGLRAVKSAAEIAKIRAAVKTNSSALERAVAAVKPGMRESALAALIDYRMRRLGADCAAFETIVAAGERGAFPHARASRARFAESQLVLVDMGAMQDGYASDMTRMLHLGEPPRKARQLYAAVLEAQLAAIDAVRPGVSGARIDRAARRVLEGRGLGEQFLHSTGHGLGLEIHEEPRIGKRSKTLMETGMVITVEPGVYLEGWGGIRIEDTVVVTERGCEILTPTPKDLRVIDGTVT